MTPEQFNAFKSLSGTAPSDLTLILKVIAVGMLIGWSMYICVSILSSLVSGRVMINSIITDIILMVSVLTIGLLLISY